MLVVVRGKGGVVLETEGGLQCLQKTLLLQARHTCIALQLPDTTQTKRTWNRRDDLANLQPVWRQRARALSFGGKEVGQGGALLVGQHIETRRVGNTHTPLRNQKRRCRHRKHATAKRSFVMPGSGRNTTPANQATKCMRVLQRAAAQQQQRARATPRFACAPTHTTPPPRPRTEDCRLAGVVQSQH
jgi:hypothetical protein